MEHMMDGDQMRTSRLTRKGAQVLIVAFVVPAVGLGVVLTFMLNYPGLLLMVLPLAALGFLGVDFWVATTFPSSVRIGGEGVKLSYRRRTQPVIVAWNNVSRVRVFHMEANPFLTAAICTMQFYRPGRRRSFVRFYSGELVCKEVEKELVRLKIPYAKKEV